MDYSLPGFSVLEILQTRILEWIAIPLFRGIFPTQGSNTGLNVIKICLLLGRKAMKNLDSVLKHSDIPLLKKVCIVKGMVFPVVMYGCESWTIKKAECERIDAFELWCWRRLLRVLWTARRSNQSVLKEIIPEYSLEELKLKLQYFGHLLRRADSLEKPLMLRKSESKRRGRQMMRWLDGIASSVDMDLSKLGKAGEDRWALACACCSPSDHKESGLTWWPNQVGQSGF